MAGRGARPPGRLPVPRVVAHTPPEGGPGVIYRSPYPDVEVPALPLHEFVLGPAGERGERPALVDAEGSVRISYRRLAELVERTAAGLHRLGFRRGEVAAICSPNRPEFAIAFFAVARLGGASTTMNPALTEAEMGAQLRDSGAVVAFTVPELADRVRAAAGGALRHVLLFGHDSFESLTRAEGTPPAVSIDPQDDVVALPYSSGTTGLPKGVMLTHRNLVANLLQMGPVERTSERDTTLAALPFYHIYGLSVILCLGLYRGATLVVLPRFELEVALRAVERWRITRLPLVPPLILRLLRDPRVAEHDLSSVRVVVSGAAPLAPELAAELADRFGVLVKQGYGMTELSPGSHMHPEEPGMAKPGTVGVLHPSTECRLVDPATGRDAAPGAPGEIWVRGPQVMKGYLNRPEATAEVLTPDGWLRTGDIGVVGEDGQLSVVDRLKELIKYMGFQVPPAEVEALLLTHPAVADAAVIPRPDPEAGEVPVAYVVRRARAELTAEELIRWVAERIVAYKRVRAVEFVDEIPRSPSGKILRRVLVERERAATGRGLEAGAG
ncbi:MAG TPA: AMP-binding protein [Candidatus Dormibacteraeota bacterium]|nr:AMP-binding protein [Candidatus Dormibacteraeota bacterium]